MANDLNRKCEKCGGYMSVRIIGECIQLNSNSSKVYIDAVSSCLLRLNKDKGLLVCDNCKNARRI